MCFRAPNFCLAISANRPGTYIEHTQPEESKDDIANLCQRPHPPPIAARNINLTDALDRFVAELIASGQYQNASEVVRDGLRLLKTQQAQNATKRAALNKAIQEGWDSFDRGEGVVVDDIDAYFAEIDAEIEAEIAAEEAATRGTAAE